MKLYESKVPEFEGLCTPTWLNDSKVCRVTDGFTTGFFKLVYPVKFMGFFEHHRKTGEEFHGYISKKDGCVYTTEGIYS